MGRFDGKVVIVTGSSSGIGQAALLGFAKEGASVVLHGVNPERLRATEQLLRDAGVPGDKVLVLPGQIELDATQDRLIQETIAKFGRIDVLVNNAGLGGKPGAKTQTETFDYVMSVNLRAPFRLVELALPHLTKTKGNIINVSSIAGITKGFNFPQVSIYGMSKCALDTFTKYECQRLAALGVRINNINSGPVETNIGKRDQAAMPEEMGKAMLKVVNKITPIGRFGQPEELVDAFLLLADEKSSYITGSCWVLDGGFLGWAPGMEDLKL